MTIPICVDLIRVFYGCVAFHGIDRKMETITTFNQKNNFEPFVNCSFPYFPPIICLDRIFFFELTPGPTVPASCLLQTTGEVGNNHQPKWRVAWCKNDFNITCLTSLCVSELYHRAFQDWNQTDMWPVVRQ